MPTTSPITGHIPIAHHRGGILNCPQGDHTDQAQPVLGSPVLSTKEKTMATETATLTFDLTDPDAARAFHRAVHALDLCLTLSDLDGELRRIIKYSEDETRADCADYWRDRLWAAIDYHGVHNIIEDL